MKKIKITPKSLLKALPGILIVGFYWYWVNQRIISDSGLPDMNGYELMLKLKEVMSPLPLVLMTGFGYDAGHSIVKARESGLKAVLYKPFRLDQLLDTVEMMLN